VKGPPEKPEPDQRHERRVKTNQIEPEDGHEFPARRPRTPQRGVPTHEGMT
jgi:hypothetical protein